MNSRALIAVIVIIIIVAAVGVVYYVGLKTSTTTNTTSSSSTTTSSSTPATVVTTSSSSPSQNSNASGQLVVAQNTDPSTLDPMVSGGSVAQNVEQYIFEPLISMVFVHNTTEFVPALATSYQQVNSTAWIFNLRQGVTFQDGTAFNATAVVVHFTRLLNKSNTHFSGSRSSIPAGFTVTVINNYEVEFTTPNPWPLLLDVMADPILGMMASPSSYLKYSVASIGPHPVGTGPYILESWQTGVKITLQAWSGYWGPKPKIQTLAFEPIADDNSRALALESNSVNFITNVPPSLIPSLQQKGYTVLNEPSTSTMMLWIDASQAPLSNRLVRLAMNYAINDSAIVQNVLQGGGTVANNGIAPSVFGYTSPSNYFTYNPTTAKSLLAQAGYSNGFSFTLYVTGSYLLDSQVAQALAGYFGAVGITANIQTINIATYLSELRAGVANSSKALPNTAGLLAEGAVDADQVYYNLWYSSSLQNYWHYSNSTYDSLVLQAHTTSNQTLRKSLYAQALQILVNNPPAIFLYYQNNIVAFSSSLKGAYQNPLGLDIFNNATIS
ncbi:MAG TPA: ABC transporter substrate-binding protein [Nitrososphaerales archaeon]|nr:ABC transporter substrate-binding protein [Nitrososphaerales archaeon]